ncbi:GPI-GlcNAc transferase complex [Trypanosoma melophagium]|uniref:GPI-GlcNAc transferase complex n=1 Tax=Trypanosoma melophagium TaxID=715481 RepID=UPI00351A263E|nr:GPI-GlcNAc transferase complex [Trypanosoma melophagium]
MSNTNNATSLPQENSPILLASNHKTSSNDFVDVFQVNFSDSVRLYRVCRRGTVGPHIPPILRLFSLKDLMFLVVFVALELPSLPMFLDYPRGIGGGSSDGWPFFPSVENGNSAMKSFGMALKLYEAAVAWHLPRFIPLLICCLVLLYRLFTGLRWAHVEEVTAIRGLGMQLTIYNIFGRIVSQRFVELKLIRALIIHDAYFRCQVIFFLSAIVENDGSLLVLFEETLPRLAVLRPLLRGLRHILYEDSEDGATLAELGERLDDSETAEREEEDEGEEDEEEEERRRGEGVVEEEVLSFPSTTLASSSLGGNITTTTTGMGGGIKSSSSNNHNNDNDSHNHNRSKKKDW